MDAQSAAYLARLSTEQINENSLRLDEMRSEEIARLMNLCDRAVLSAVEGAVPEIGRAIDAAAERMLQGGRLIYMGAGTSGRLGVLDASECPPTFGVSPELVAGVIAGGDRALRHAQEGAEDSEENARRDLAALHLRPLDTVCAISASGYAPYCVAALEEAKKAGALCLSVCCNKGARLSSHADIAIEAPTGAEVLAGSTRLKAGTATKMILNMLSTGVMARTGRVYQNLMVDVVSSNDKLKDRAARILMSAAGLPRDRAEQLLAEANGHVKTALVMHLTGEDREGAQARLRAAQGNVRRAAEL